MPGAVRLGDLCQPHSGWSNQYLTSGSPTVKVNGISVSRISDNVSVHNNGDSSHPSSQYTGSPNVNVNSRRIARVQDSIKCGSTNKSGSPNVNIN